MFSSIVEPTLSCSAGILSKLGALLFLSFQMASFTSLDNGGRLGSHLSLENPNSTVGLHMRNGFNFSSKFFSHLSLMNSIFPSGIPSLLKILVVVTDVFVASS